MLSSNPRILYVDDKDCYQMIDLMLSLAAPGYEFVGVTSAEKAINIMAKEKFDLYVLEYQIAGTSGIELCRHIRRSDSKTPILFFTGMARVADRNVAKAAGATEYFVKPNDLEQIVETIARLLNKVNKGSSIPETKSHLELKLQAA